jgi:hypothetical protein
LKLGREFVETHNFYSQSKQGCAVD